MKCFSFLNRTLLAGATISLFSISAFAQKSKVADNIDLVFHNTTGMLQQIHYAPQPLNDHFSTQVFNEYLQQLDPGKRFFLKADITRFKQFEWQLDDEMRGKMVQFYKVVNEVYKQRVKDAEKLINELLAHPFSFSSDEYFNDQPKNILYSKSADELKARWKNYLKYQVLVHFDDLTEQKKKDTAASSEAQLEAKARETVGRIEKRSIENILKLTVDEEAFNLYLNSVINLYDPHSSYFLPVDRREFQEGMSGIYYGIGALLQEAQGKVSIAELMIGGPAWKSGQVEKGDVLVKVSQGGSDKGTDLAGLAISEVIKLTRGQKGTTVVITFRKNDGSLREVTMKREALQLEDTFVKSAIINNDSGKIGYITFPKFYTNFGDANGRSCATDMAVELEKLKAENVDGVVIDIRDNSGGSLSEVINMVGLFIKEGPVVQVKSATGAPYVSQVRNANVLYDGPLVVMVNEMSASAAEIFAAAIQDYHRGIVIGASSTYGKGSVQRGFGVSDNKQTYSIDNIDLGTIHITLQKYYRITGGTTQLKGVSPDILLPGIYEPYKIQEKDNPTALKWDTIAPAPFVVSNHSEEVKNTIAAAGNRLTQDSLLLALRRQISWLDNRSSMHAMQLTKFRAEKKQLQQNIAQIRKMLITTDSLPVINTADVQEELKNKEQFRNDSNRSWLNSLKKDLFLSEAVWVMQTWFRSNRHNS
ncbi:carboxy terminal-processing peptidase [Pseudoflavitalea sp. G-6-1-2]|uniref:carboxy terminal-processing peptidase n=1 Tax=Pseudoflavitalea sp. G-6-1-2 TaxID=2728841 RepID=UPI00146E1582|nr:carboxy terminal-processing peptidase [Pseudoflavitalea sp. G-6-1-2]NML23735.1 carboxy terminal-processing peptidase [Pseudoflavitalea sp. G-6-1-2]